MTDSMFLSKVRWRLSDIALQWLWFVLPVDEGHIGYDKGLLTWVRTRRHKRIHRPVRICLLDVYPDGGKFGKFTAFWINERSSVCSASVNRGIRDADIAWIYSQDPLPAEVKDRLLETLARCNPSARVINHPDAYNSYHEDTCFERLEAAGASVPRSKFGERDIGRTEVVYKVKGAHGSTKFRSLYKGPVEGYRPFEFHDSRGPDGLYRKFRAFYILGNSIPNHVALGANWNVHRTTKISTEYVFDLTDTERASVELIAKTLNLQYFSVDFIRRREDGQPFFSDINVYPLPIDFTETARQMGYFGRWLILDNRLRLGMPEPSGRCFWEMFDDAMLHLKG
ncbi:MAG TPA: hypothetical protein VK435_11430 [Thermodesulfovibrionales bacterium]|nr:hypothetical protein [Thermodesulfovibrionales bacterium]